MKETLRKKGQEGSRFSRYSMARETHQKVWVFSSGRWLGRPIQPLGVAPWAMAQRSIGISPWSQSRYSLSSARVESANSMTSKPKR